MMSSLAQLVAPHHLLADNIPSQLIGFDYREHCLQSVFWNVYRNLEQGKRTVLVCDNEKDLQYIFYLLSTYNVHQLSLLIHNNSKVSESLVEKFEQEANRKLASNQRRETTLYDILISLRNRTAQNVKNLSEAIIGNKSVLDLQDLTLSAKQYQDGFISHSLFDAISGSDVQRKTAIYDQAQKLYKSKFQFLDREVPINKETLNNEDRTAILTMINELISQAELLENKSSIVESAIRQKVELQHTNSLSQVKDEVMNLQTLLKQSKPYNETDLTKLLFQEQTLFKKLDIGSEAPTTEAELEEGLARIKYALENRYASHYRMIHLETETKLAMLTPASSSSMDIMSFLDGVNELMTKVKQYDILIDFKVRKSTAFKFQRDNLIMLKNRLESARYFIEANQDYWEWLDFQASLSDVDRSVVSELKSQTGFWGDAFQRQYLGYVVNQKKVEMESVTDLTLPLGEALAAYTNNHHQDIFHLWDEQKSIIKPVSDDWKFFLDENAISLLDRYPVLVVSSDFYKSYGARLVNATDVFYFVDHLPKEHYEHKTSNVSFGYNNNYKDALRQSSADNNSFAVSTNTDSSYLVTKRLENMPLADRNIAANYLGKKMRRLAPKYKIYQLRHHAIISFWSDKWNTQLLEQLAEQGIKEIFSDDDAINLIPATLADADRSVHILLEDNFFARESEVTVIQQHILLDELQTAGMTIKSLDNYKWMTTGKSEFQKIVSDIIQFEETTQFQTV